MKKTIYLINPRANLLQGYVGTDMFSLWGSGPAQMIGDLAVTTVAALVPDEFEIRLCDEQLTPVDLDTDADFVGLTGKVSQAPRLLALAREFRRRGRVVLIGGPFASLDPEAARPYCDILVRGEIEEIAPTLFADLLRGEWAREYVGGKPDLALSPMPRWDLYPNDRTFSGCVQTSRGCPFECEFCDVIVYLGRKQRHKPIDQVLAELDVLAGLGYREVFFADDNFTVFRQRAKELLVALGAWNRRQPGGPLEFNTQLSIDAARDDELLRLLGEAGFVDVFIGIETPNEESLRETKKRQNVGRDLLEDVGRFLDHGIMVRSGVMVGFDADGPDIFDRQQRFIQSSPIALLTVGSLVAPTGTPLYERMAREGRLVTGALETPAVPWDTNIIPRRMTREELVLGMRRLVNAIYDPDAFGDRVIRMIDRLGPKQGPPARGDAAMSPQRAQLVADFNTVIKQLAQSGGSEGRMVTRIVRHAITKRPDTMTLIGSCLLWYTQARILYKRADFWDADSSFLSDLPATPGWGTSTPSVALVDREPEIGGALRRETTVGA